MIEDILLMVIVLYKIFRYTKHGKISDIVFAWFIFGYVVFDIFSGGI